MQLKVLWELQQVEQSLEEISGEIKQKELVDILKDKQKRIAEIQEVIEKEEKEVAEIESKVRNLEQELTILVDKKKDQEKKLYDGSINDPKELENMRGKLVQLEEMINRLENQVLSNMDNLEDKVHLLNQHTGQVEEFKKSYNKDVRLYQRNKKELSEKKSVFEKKRTDLTGSLGESLLDKYHRIQKQYRNAGIARVENGICSGCRVEIPILHLKNIKEGNNIYICEQCGRILIWTENVS